MRARKLPGSGGAEKKGAIEGVMLPGRLDYPGNHLPSLWTLRVQLHHGRLTAHYGNQCAQTLARVFLSSRRTAPMFWLTFCQRPPAKRRTLANFASSPEMFEFSTRCDNSMSFFFGRPLTRMSRLAEPNPCLVPRTAR